MANVHSNYVQPQALNFHMTLFRAAELYTLNRLEGRYCVLIPSYGGE